MKSILFVISFIFLMAAGLTAQTESQINSTKNGIAVKGYDMVAYFTVGEPVKGSDEFTFEYQGALWHFSTAENLALFTESPEQYAPQYGGYCAWAMGSGYYAGFNPQQWDIIDGKLYLNYSRSTRRKWLADLESLVQSGDEYWAQYSRERALEAGAAETP